jgi:malonyl CoA-acyl carrier protein transacylase
MTTEPTTAILFPGQGSQESGMRELVAVHAPDLLEDCLRMVGDDPFERLDESTRFAQPAIFCASVAGWRRAADAVPRPVAVAGHSLGEFAALVAAEAIDARAALELVVLRGRLMAEAGERAGGGTMLALLGAHPAQALELAAAHDAVIANDNAPGQLVISGPTGRLTNAARTARAEGVKAIELGVAGAFHSPTMEPAVPPFAAALAEAPFVEPAVPVVSCLTAAPMGDPATELADGLTRPVRWTQTLRALHVLGARRFLDAGPGRVLVKLVKRTLRDAEAGPLPALEAAGA